MTIAPDYLSRLEAALGKCETMDQFRSVFRRAGVGDVIDDKRTSTEECLTINAIVARERDRIQGDGR